MQCIHHVSFLSYFCCRGF